MGKNTIETKQDVLLLTGNGNGVRVTFDASPDSIIDFKNNRAWELAYPQQCEEEKTGKTIQIISEVDQTPITIYRNRPELDSSSDLFNRKVKEGLSTIEHTKNKTGMILWVGIVAALMAVTITAVVLVKIL